MPGLTPKDLTGSFYELLRDALRRSRSSSGTQAIEPTVTNEEESAALGVPLHSPAFLFERTSRDAGRPHGRVRPVGLPGRPLPDRHRAQPPLELTASHVVRS